MVKSWRSVTLVRHKGFYPGTTMPAVTLDFLREQLDLGEQLLAGRGSMFAPQDLPGRYGGVVKAVDRLLILVHCPAVVAGGWAVWRHGYVGHITQDLDIVLPQEQIADFLKTAAVSGFEVAVQAEGPAEDASQGYGRVRRRFARRRSTWHGNAIGANDNSPSRRTRRVWNVIAVHQPIVLDRIEACRWPATG
jgi:hypothetical protein